VESHELHLPPVYTGLESSLTQLLDTDVSPLDWNELRDLKSLSSKDSTLVAEAVMSAQEALRARVLQALPLTGPFLGYNAATVVEVRNTGRSAALDVQVSFPVGGIAVLAKTGQPETRDSGTVIHVGDLKPKTGATVRFWTGGLPLMSLLSDKFRLVASNTTGRLVFAREATGFAGWWVEHESTLSMIRWTLLLPLGLLAIAYAAVTLVRRLTRGRGTKR
jgi:hypothetical protein